MLAVTDTALDLLVLELVLELLLLGVLLLGVLTPVDAGSEHDVLGDRGRVRGGTRAVLGALAELGPCLAVGDAGIHRLLVGGVADAAGCLDLVSVFVDTVRDDGLCAVLVGNGLGGRQLGGGLVDIVVVGPVVPVGDGGVSQGLPNEGARTAHSLGLVRDGGSHDESLRTEVSGLSATDGERDAGIWLNGRCGVRSWGFSVMVEFITFSWCGDNGGAATLKPHIWRL